MQILFIHLDETRLNTNNQHSACITNESFMLNQAGKAGSGSSILLLQLPFADLLPFRWLQSASKHSAALQQPPGRNPQWKRSPHSPRHVHLAGSGVTSGAGIGTKQVKCFGSATATSRSHRLTGVLCDLPCPITRPMLGLVTATPAKQRRIFVLALPQTCKFSSTSNLRLSRNSSELFHLHHCRQGYTSVFLDHQF